MDSMNHKDRFRRVFTGEPVDRLPVLFFGTWAETKVRWAAEGIAVDSFEDPGPQLAGMDPDWERGLWTNHGLLTSYAVGRGTPEVLEETADHVVFRDALGATIKAGKNGSSVQHVLEHALKPDRASWERFKPCLDARDANRWTPGWERLAEAAAAEDRVLPLMGGSLYGWLRNFMGVEELSCLMYEDPELFQEIIDATADYFIDLFRPLVEKVRFDLIYLFEDCCGANGPLFSPAQYRRFFDAPYRRLVAFYKEHGDPLVLLDSDGETDALIPSWLGSGIDILFPVEVGKWGASPGAIRARHGSGVKMVGGVDKHVIARGEGAIREHLLGLLPAARQSGYLPMPDHRIPPEVGLEDMRTYVRVFREVFA